MSNANLKIEIAENGFVVYEAHYERAVIGNMWAFESAETLAIFVNEWGDGNTKVSAKPQTAKG